MSSLLALLSNSAVALDAQQGVAAVANNNLSNVDTPGYSRQTANLQAASMNVLGGAVLGGGASIGSITQTRDRFVEAQLPGAFGASSFSQAESGSLSSVDALDTNQSGGITDSLSQFWAALQSLSQDAGNQSLRTAAVSSASQVASSFNQTYSALNEAQTGLDTQVQNSLSNVNSLAQQMAALNKQIRVATGAGQQPNALLDQRQQLQDQLEQLTGAVPVTDAQGDVSLVLPQGDALVSTDAAATLSAQPDASNGGHVSLYIVRTDGTGPAALTSGQSDSAIGGQLGGWLQARDGALGSAMSSLNTLATDFAKAVNAAHSSSYGLDGSTGNDLFPFPGTGPAAEQLGVNCAIVSDTDLLATKGSSSAGAGDASGLATLIDVQSSALASGQTPSNAMATITAQFGSAAQNASNQSTQDQTTLGQLTNLRSSASGVSSDEELVNMQKAQAAYQAISKVITTTQTMLDALMAIQST